MVTTTGKRLSIKNLRGKVVLYDFWATWCGPCKAASPSIQKLYETFGPKGLVVIGADGLESEAGPKGAIAYAKAHHYHYMFTYGNDMLEQSMGITAIPAFVLVDKQGFIADARVGLPNGNPDSVYTYFAPKIKKLLAQ